MNIWNNILLGQIELTNDTAKDWFGTIGAVALTALVIKWLLNDRERQEKEKADLQKKYTEELIRQRDEAQEALKEGKIK